LRSQLAFLLACACALLGTVAATTAQADPTPQPESRPTWATAPRPPSQAALTARKVEQLINRYRRQVWHWQRVMGHRVTRRLKTKTRELAASVPVWQRVAARTWKRAQHPPHEAAWRCIHRFEGSWNDSRPPYYGGLQMDLGFQLRYAPYLLRRKGTANRWTPLEQMWAGERAIRSGRGFYPWPNTARFCGLL
jgi:hypothetical protein